MSIEAQLDVLAENGREQVALLKQLISLAEGMADLGPQDYTKQRIQEVRAEVGGQRARGKGAVKGTVLKGPQEPKEEKPAQEPAPEPQKPVDDFLEEAPPVKVVTLNEVREGLIAYRAAKMKELGDAKGKEAAMALLAKHGNGATLLPGTAASKLPDGSEHPGALKPEYFAAVVAAIGAAG